MWGYSNGQFHTYVCNTFTVYTITRKILEQSVPIFLWTLKTLGQHEFVFGFCGSIRSIAVAGICDLWVLLLMLWMEDWVCGDRLVADVTDTFVYVRVMKMSWFVSNDSTSLCIRKCYLDMHMTFRPCRLQVSLALNTLHILWSNNWINSVFVHKRF